MTIASAVTDVTRPYASHHRCLDHHGRFPSSPPTISGGKALVPRFFSAGTRTAGQMVEKAWRAHIQGDCAKCISSTRSDMHTVRECGCHTVCQEDSFAGRSRKPRLKDTMDMCDSAVDGKLAGHKVEGGRVAMWCTDSFEGQRRRFSWCLNVGPPPFAVSGLLGKPSWRRSSPLMRSKTCARKA